MSTKQGLLNETADSSRVQSFEVDSTYSSNNFKTSKKKNDKHFDTQSDSRKGGLMIVHPSYSLSPSKAFHGQGSQYTAIDLGNFSKTSSLPPQQYGGMLDDLLCKDTQFKIQMTENELNSNYFSCYRYWIIFLIPFSLMASGGFLWLLSHPAPSVPVTFIILASILAFWNAVQCLLEYISIRTKSVTKAEKTVIMFSVYLIILFLYSIGVCLIVEPKYLTGIGYELKIPTAIVTGIIVPIIYYYTTVSGAVKVYHILRRRQALVRNLEAHSQVPPEL